MDTQELCGRKTRRGYNMTTASGLPFWPEDPRPEDVRIEDIAAQLSRLCRFNGALKYGVEIYSVAQHSVLVSRHVPESLALPALLHDAAEAYLGDLIKPLKAAHGPRRRKLEERVEAAIAARFGFAQAAFHEPEIKMADYRAVLTEHRDLQIDVGAVDWGEPRAEPFPDRIIPLLPSSARSLFIDRFDELWRRRVL